MNLSDIAGHDSGLQEGSKEYGDIMHEFFHTLGMLHEHQHPERKFTISESGIFTYNLYHNLELMELVFERAREGVRQIRGWLLVGMRVEGSAEVWEQKESVWRFVQDTYIFSANNFVVPQFNLHLILIPILGRLLLLTPPILETYSTKWKLCILELGITLLKVRSHLVTWW